MYRPTHVTFLGEKNIYKGDRQSDQFIGDTSQIHYGIRLYRDWIPWAVRSWHYLLFFSCTCSRNQPVPYFRKTLTNQEGVTFFSVCGGALTVLEGSHGKVMKCCSAVEPRWEPFKGFAWYFWIVWLSLLSFLPVWGENAERAAGVELVLWWEISVCYSPCSLGRTAAPIHPAL